MANKKTRTAFHKRERRKGRQSEWTREGKANPKKVGHGGSGATQNSTYKQAKPSKKNPKPEKSVTFNYAIPAEELAKLKPVIEQIKRKGTLWEGIR